MLTSPILLAILGGVVPTFVWLWFWLREDRKHPEPRHLIILSFILGGLAVPFAIPFEKIIESSGAHLLIILIGWAIVEEGLKYLAAFIGGMHTQAEDEPIDAMIYLITAALGFAAAENTLFILQPFLTGDIFTGLVTANIRFVGTTLLHILSSSVIGAAIAFSFYKRKKVKKEYFIGGFGIAVILHAVFNFLILKSGPNHIFTIFLVIWIAIILLLMVFERVKRIRR
jgi:RsiW-degrading membrane proteinase PrsW (M82 family)